MDWDAEQQRLLREMLVAHKDRLRTQVHGNFTADQGRVFASSTKRFEEARSAWEAFLDRRFREDPSWHP